MPWTSETELKILEDLINTTTPGPWASGHGRRPPPDIDIFYPADLYSRGDNKPNDNVRFAATVREAIPHLINEIRRLRRSL